MTEETPSETQKMNMKTPPVRRNSWGRRKNNIIDQEIEAYPPDLRDLFTKDDDSDTGSVIESPSASGGGLSHFPFAMACREFEHMVMSLRRNMDALNSRLSFEKERRESLESKVDRLEEDKKAGLQREADMMETIQNLKKRCTELRTMVSDSVEESKKSVSEVASAVQTMSKSSSDKIEQVSNSIREDMKENVSKIQNSINTNVKSIENEKETRSKEILSMGSKMNMQSQNLERLQMTLFEIKQKHRENDEHVKELAQSQEESEVETKRLVESSKSEIKTQIQDLEKRVSENVEDHKRETEKRELERADETKKSMQDIVNVLKRDIASCESLQNQNTEELRDLLEGLLAKEQNERERVEGKLSEMVENVKENLEQSRQAREHLRKELLDLMRAHTERERNELMQKLTNEVQQGSKKRDELLSKIASEQKRERELLQKELQSKKNWTPDQMVSDCMVCNTAFTFFRRKHHCRECGSVICNNCSKWRQTSSPSGEKSLLRICKSCNVTSPRRTSDAFTTPDVMTRAKMESEKQIRELEEAKQSSEEKPPAQTPFVARILDPF